MNKQESDILNVLLLEPFINQRILAEVSGHSLGVVNRSIKELIKADYLDESIRPTMKAIMEFKQKKPQRAVILAAGFGMRMVPINTEMPKGLLEVNGEPLIERIIKQLHEVGIKEIYVVVGYLKEQFNYLEDKYENLHLIDNPYYDTCNNISSLYVARNHLKNVIILDGDQIINNTQILSKEFKYSGYNCIYKQEIHNEWMLKLENGFVTSCSRTGGQDGWQLYSVSRWNEEDGKKLKKHLEIEFEEKKNTDIYWDDVALFCYPNEYQLSIKEMHEGDILEIDSFDELCSIDETYLNWGK